MTCSAWEVKRPNWPDFVPLEELGLLIYTWEGDGMPPMVNSVQPFAALPGGFFQGMKIGIRTLTLIGLLGPAVADNYRHDRAEYKIDQVALSQTRQRIIDVFTPTLGESTPIQLRYTGGVDNAGTGKKLVANVRYDGGLEGGSEVAAMQEIFLPLIMVDPFFYEEDEQTATIDAYEQLTGTNEKIVTRSSVYGWRGYYDAANVLKDVQNLAYIGDTPYIISFTAAGNPIGEVMQIYRFNANNQTITLAADTGSQLYQPDFTAYALRGDALYIHTIDNLGQPDVWKFDGSSLNIITAPALGFIKAMDVYPGVGLLFATGDKLVQYNISTDTTTELVSAVSGGVDPTINTVAYHNGRVYIGGTFTSATVGGTNVTGNVIDVTTKKSIATGTGTVYKLLGNETKPLLMVADLTINGVAYNGISEYRAPGWYSYNQPSADFVDYDAADNLYSIDKTGGNWNGTLQYIGYAPQYVGAVSWTSGFDYLATSKSNVGLALLEKGNALVIYPGTTTVRNSGTYTAYPVITITNSAATRYLYRIDNITTNTAIVFDGGLAIETGETITLRTGVVPSREIMTSNYAGNITNRIAAGSRVDRFGLENGDNIITAASDGTGLTITMTWQPTHLSLDGAAAR